MLFSFVSSFLRLRCYVLKIFDLATDLFRTVVHQYHVAQYTLIQTVFLLQLNYLGFIKLKYIVVLDAGFTLLDLIRELKTSHRFYRYHLTTQRFNIRCDFVGKRYSFILYFADVQNKN